MIKIITKLQETIIGLALIILSIIFYHFPTTYLYADIMALLATIICGKDMVIKAVKGIIKGQLNVAELIVIAIVASLAIGEYLVAAEVAFIMTAGGYLEERVIDKSQKAIKDLAAMLPSQACLKLAGQEKMISTNEIKPQDIVLVKPGEEIPVDGTIVKGISLVSEAGITGESKPVGKMVDDMVFAGSLNLDGVLEIETMKVGKESFIGRIAQLTNKALQEKTPTIRLADRLATWFTPLVLSLTFVVYLLSGDLYRAITVLVILCPCTLVLAIPSALAASLGKAVKNGILLKGGVYLEKAAEVDTLLLDKTGTLTYGKPKIVKIIPFDHVSEDYLLSQAAIAEKDSTHPIALQIINEARKRGLDIPDSENVKSIPGRGMVVKVKGKKISVSSMRFLGEGGYENAEKALAVSAEEENFGRTTFYIAVDKNIIGIIALEDTLRVDVLENLKEIKKLIPRLILLTGDNYSTAYQLSADIGISEFKAQLLPEEKFNTYQELKSQDKVVAAVGDGINDAPLLAAVDVGIAMGDTATSVALDAGSVVIVNGDFSKLSLFFKIAQNTRAIIKQNIIIFAIIYNLAGFILASLGYLTPLQGAIVHNVGSTAVVLNSTRLLK